MKNKLRIQSREHGIAGGKTAPGAFTLIGLVMVIAVSAFLAAMMLPMLTRAKTASQTTQCMNGMKQMGLGIDTYADNHNQHYPAAALEDINFDNGGPMSWDVWIDRYVGGNRDLSQLGNIYGGGGGGGDVSVKAAPKILRCPADTGVNQAWAFGYDAMVQRRSYSMNAANPQPPQYLGMQNCSPPYYPPLPTPQQGIGINWQEPSHTADWNAPGYPTRVIQDAAGTIVLAEAPDGDNLAGNAWMSVVQGPTNNSPGTIGGGGANYLSQLNANDVWNYGSMVYAAHGQKFNYLFHDNHVSGLTWQQTLGTTPTNNIPNGPYYGMWTIKPGD